MHIELRDYTDDELKRIPPLSVGYNHLRNPFRHLMKDPLGSELAVANRDRVLGAAILSRLDSMKSEDRKAANVARQELAEALVGDDFKNARAAIQRIKNRTREALSANRGFMTGKGMSLRDKIGLALNRGAEKGANDD